MKYQCGDIGFKTNKGFWFNRLLCWWMQGQWAHSFLILGEFEGEILLLESAAFQVVVTSMDEYIDQKGIVFEVYRFPTLSLEDKAKIIGLSFASVKTYYGYLQLIGIGTRNILHRFGIHIKNFIHRGRVCDQLVIDCHQVPSSPLWGVDPDNLDVMDLYRVCAKWGVKVGEQ